VGILNRITSVLAASVFLLPTEWCLPWNDESFCYLFLARCSWDPGCFGNSLCISSWRLEKGRKKKKVVGRGSSLRLHRCNKGESERQKRRG